MLFVNANDVLMWEFSGGDSFAYRGPSNDLDGQITVYVVLERAASYIINAVVVVLPVSFSLRRTRFFYDTQTTLGSPGP